MAALWFLLGSSNAQTNQRPAVAYLDLVAKGADAADAQKGAWDAGRVEALLRHARGLADKASLGTGGAKVEVGRKAMLGFGSLGDLMKVNKD